MIWCPCWHKFYRKKNYYMNNFVIFFTCIEFKRINYVIFEFSRKRNNKIPFHDLVAAFSILARWWEAKALPTWINGAASQSWMPTRRISTVTLKLLYLEHLKYSNIISLRMLGLCNSHEKLVVLVWTKHIQIVAIKWFNYFCITVLYMCLCFGHAVFCCQGLVLFS